MHRIVTLMRQVVSCRFQLPWMNEFVIVHPWKARCRVEVLRNGERQDEHYDLPVVSDALADVDPAHPIARFAANIPQHITEIVGDYGCDQLAMFHVCSWSSRALDMLESAPTLLWYLAPHLASGMTGGAIHDLLGEKRHVLLGRVCGRNEPWLARFIAKLHPPAGYHSARETLDRLLATPHALETLRHRSLITWGLLKIAAENMHMFCFPAGRRLFRENIALNELRKRARACSSLLVDTAKLGQQLGVAGYGSLINACKIYAQIARLHERWSDQVLYINSLRTAGEKNDSFPAPPLAGSQHIEPITTLYDLLVEGKVMRHCIDVHESDIRSGKSYIYRVLYPERATLEMRITPRQGWMVRRLKTSGGRVPRMETKRFVQMWLKNSQLNT